MLHHFVLLAWLLPPFLGVVTRQKHTETFDGYQRSQNDFRGNTRGLPSFEAKPLWTCLFKQLTKKHLSVQPGNCSSARLPVHLFSHTCLLILLVKCFKHADLVMSLMESIDRSTLLRPSGCSRLRLSSNQDQWGFDRLLPSLPPGMCIPIAPAILQR